MKFIAVTGSYASGKSFVSKCFLNKGYKVFSCDDYVKELYLDPDIQNKIINLLDLKIFEKKEIIDKIYNHDFMRIKLENYIHPLVREGIKEFKERNLDAELLLTEIPLLFEKELDPYFDYSICVYCSESNRLTRAKEREGFNLKIYKKIKEIQLSPKNKIKLANFRVNTDYGFADTIERVKEIIKKLIKI